MASQGDVDSSCDETSSSLGDSTYDFVDDKSVLTTDDEHEGHMTGSVMSSDGAGRDEPSPPASTLYPTPPPEPNAEDGFDVLASTLKTPLQESTSRAADELTQGDDTVLEKPTKVNQDTIVFEEPWPRLENISEVSYSLDDDLDLQDVEGRDSDGDARPDGRLVSISLRQSMMPSSLDVQGKLFRILFFGPSAWKEVITQKIASALAAVPTLHKQQVGRAQPSRFNIVPVSGFEDGKNPEVVLIDSSGLELDVEEIAATSTYLTHEMNSKIIGLKLSNGTFTRSIPNGRDFVVSKGWSLPDLGVLCIPNKSYSKAAWSSLQDRSDVREYMRRHNIPVLGIAESISTKESREDASDIDKLAPHICLEFEHWHPNGYQFRTCETSPLDLDTFLKIDAGQLNRSLACLPVPKRSREEQNGSVQNTVACYIQQAQVFFSPLSNIPVTLLLLAGMLLILSFFSNSVNIKDHGSLIVPHATTTAATQMRVTSEMSQSASSTTRPHLPGFSSAVTPVTNPTLADLPDQTDIASFISDADTRAPKRPEQFKIYVLGDCHIVLRPPHWFTKVKRAAPLLFRISRDNVSVEHRSLTLFEGIHALQIPREEAFGLLAVNIWTQSRPLLNETVNVDFGSSWLKVSAWKRGIRVMSEGVQSDLYQISNTLSGIYDQTMTDLEVISGRAKDKLTVQVNTELASVASLASRLNRKIQSLIRTRTTDLSHILWQRFHGAQKSTSRYIQIWCTDIMRHVSTYTDSRRHTISYHARTFAHAATGIDVRRLGVKICRLNSEHLRFVQKKVLKAWWTVKGVPQRKSDGIEAQLSARNWT